MKKATDYLNEFDAIALKENKTEAIEFLKKLPKEVKVSFRKGLVKLDKFAHDHTMVEIENGHFQYNSNRTSKYKEVLFLGALATCTGREMKKFESGWAIFFTPEAEEMIIHCKPNWLTGAINENTRRWWRLGSFFEIKEFQEKDYIGEIEAEGRAARLREQPIAWLKKVKSRRRSEQKLSKQYNELSEKQFNWIKADLPLLFKYDLGFGDNYGGNRGRWQIILKDWSKQRKIERSQLIIWTFDTFPRPFNRQTGAFFRGYLDSLELSLNEKLAQQDRYIEMLSNANPHHVSYALKEIKKLEKSAKFNNESLVENLEPVLVSDSKGTVKNALMLLERTAKKEKELIPEICIVVLLALVSEENDIQKRVLSILEKIAPKGDDELSDELMIYFENIHPSLQPDFQVFLTKTHQEASSITSNEVFEIQKINVLSTESQIKPIENWEDWIYLAGAVYESKEPNPTDVERLFEGAVLLYTNKRTRDILERMNPLIQRIKKTRNQYWSEPNTIIGAFINVIYWMLKTKPKEWAKVKRKAFLQFDKRSLKSYITIKQLLFNRFLMYLKLVFKRTNLPVLSMSTHYGAWIDPLIFIEKLQVYSQQNEIPVILDVAYALTKLNLTSTEEASKQAQRIEGKLGEIIRFVLGDEEELVFNESSGVSNEEESKIDWALTGFTEQPKATAILYLNAFRTRFPQQNMTNFKAFGYEAYFNTAEFGGYTWDATQKKEQYKDYNGKLSETYIRNYMVVETATNNFFTNEHELFTLFLYQHLWVNETLYSVGLFNMKWFISLLPNNAESIFSFYNKHFGQFASDYEYVESRIILRAIIDFNIPLQEMGTLFIACTTTYADKVSRGMATEVLIHLLNQNALNLPLFSTNLGKLVNRGYGRLQRILPCLQQISDVSDFHAKSIQSIIENMLKEFPTDTLPRNTKKLLELLLNLSLKNKQSVNLISFEKQMPIWQKNASLKKVIKQFE